MMEASLLGVVLLFGLLIRVAFLAGEDSDEWGALWFIHRQRGHRRWVYELDDSVLGGKMGYPVLNHFLLSRLSPRHWVGGGRLLNALYDLATALLLFLSVSKWGAADTAGLGLPLAVTLLFLSSPILLPTSARMKAISARSMGLLVLTIYLAALGHALIHGGWAGPAVAVLAGYLAIIGSQFATQTLAFFSLGLALMMFSWLPVAIVAGAVALAYVAGGRPPLALMYHHKIWYARNLQVVATTASNRNDWRRIVALPKTLVQSPRLFISRLFKQVTPFIAAYSAPAVLLLLALWAGGDPLFAQATAHPWGEYAWALTLVSAIVFVLVSLPPLAFLGEAERYLEYSTPWYLGLFVYYLGLGGDPVWFWLILSLHLVGTAANLAYQAGFAPSGNESVSPPGLRECLRWLASTHPGARVALVPIKQSFLASAIVREERLAPVFFYYQFVLRPGERGFGYFERDIGGLAAPGRRMPDSMNVFKSPPRELVAAYGLTHLIVEQGFLAGLRATWSEDGAEVLERPVFGAGRFTIFALSPEANGGRHHGPA